LDQAFFPRAAHQPIEQDAGDDGFEGTRRIRVTLSHTITDQRVVIGGHFDLDAWELAGWHQSTLLRVESQPGKQLTNGGSEPIHDGRLVLCPALVQLQSDAFEFRLVLASVRCENGFPVHELGHRHAVPVPSCPARRRGIPAVRDQQIIDDRAKLPGQLRGGTW